MSQVLGSTIIAICLSAQGSYNQACNKALEAGSKQSGVYQEIDGIEKGTIKYINTQAEKRLTKNEMSAVATGYLVYKTTKDKKIQINLPTLGLFDKVHSEISPTSYNVRFQWNF